MIGQMRRVEVISLFVEDLAAARGFYAGLLELPVVYEDAVSAVVGLDGLMINLLQATQAPDLVAPMAVGPAGAGPRAMLTVRVEDVDAMFAALSARGVAFLNGPIDRPWGRRTAAFADPDGNAWEIAQVIASAG